MTPKPTTSTGFLPPVMDKIIKGAKGRKVSLGAPSFVEEARKKSASLTNLSFEDGENDVHYDKAPYKGKSNSVMHSIMKKQSRDDLALEHKKNYRHSEMSHKNSPQIINTSKFLNYDRYLQDERKDFEFRLENMLEPSGCIDDFSILKRLQSGQFGQVYLAEDKMDKKQYAIKTICKDLIRRDNIEKEVEAERDYLYATNSPFIVSLSQYFEDDLRVYFVMEYVRDGELFEHLKNHGPFSEDLTRFYAAQVVLALEYMHNVGLIYRDLKPENIMIDSNGYIKLVDLGFVKRVEKKTYSMVGTPAYMTPEIIIHKSYDKTIDWWALGILIYEMLAGLQITPFYDSNRNAMYNKINSKEVTFPSSNRFPQTVVRDLIKRLLKKNPSYRLGSGDNGSKDIKNHPWFASVKWLELHRRTLTPIVAKQKQFQKVAALKHSLLGGNRQPAVSTIQNRLQLERILKLR